MKAAPTLDRIIAFLKIDLLFACCWPLPRSATKFQIIRDKIFRYLLIINGAFIVVEGIYAISRHLDNVYLIIEIAAELGTFSQSPVQIYLFTLQHDRLQNVICDMEDYYKQANVEEKNKFQKYINKNILIYGSTLILMTLTFSGAIIVPLRQSQILPLRSEYPFRVDYQPMIAIIYFHQVLAIYQVYCQVCANVFLALLLWFTTIRFDILANKFLIVTKYSDWKICIQEHQKTVRFAEEVSNSIAYVILSSLSVSTTAVVFCGVAILSQFPLFVKFKYTLVFFTSMIKIFLCAWPADHLMRMSSNIAEAVYSSSWYNQSIKSQKIVLYTLLRCQRAVVISVPGFLKALTLQHYASYLSTAFSFLTTFRIILSEET